MNPIRFQLNPEFILNLKQIILPEFPKTIYSDQNDHVIILSYNNDSTVTFHLFCKENPNHIEIKELNINLTNAESKTFSKSSVGYMTTCHPLMLSFLSNEICPLDSVTECEISMKPFEQNESKELELLKILLLHHINHHAILNQDFLNFVDNYFLNFYSISSNYNIQSYFCFKDSLIFHLSPFLDHWNFYRNCDQNNSYQSIYQFYYNDRFDPNRYEKYRLKPAEVHIQRLGSEFPAKNSTVTINFIKKLFPENKTASNQPKNIPQCIKDYDLYVRPNNRRNLIHSAFPFRIEYTTFYAVPKHSNLIVDVKPNEDNYMYDNLGQSFRIEEDGCYFYLFLTKTQFGGPLFRLKVDIQLKNYKMANTLFEKYNLTDFFEKKQFSATFKYVDITNSWYLSDLKVEFGEPNGHENIRYQTSHKFDVPPQFIMPDHYSVAWIISK